MESNPFLRQAEEAANGAPAHASASGTPSAEELTQIVRSEVDAMHEADVQQRAKELLNGSAFTVGEIDKSLARMPLVVQLARKSYEQKPEDLMRFSNVLRNQALLERAKGVLQAQQASNDEPAAKPSAPGTSPWDRPKIRPGTNLDFVELNNPANAPQTDFGKQVNRGASTKGFGKGAGSRGAQLMQSAQKANPATQGNANRKLSTAAKTKPAPLMGLGGNGWNRSPCGFCGDMCNARDLQTVEVDGMSMPLCKSCLSQRSRVNCSVCSKSFQPAHLVPAMIRRADSSPVKGSVCMKCEEREDVVSEAPSRKLPPPKRARTETGGKQTRLVLNSVKSSSFYPGPTRLEGLKEVEGGMQVNGGSRVLQPKPAARDASPAPAAPAAKRTRQQLQQVQQHANQVAASLQKLGTADNPITLDSDDEAGPSAPAPAATRRPTRSTAYASASERLQGLRCLMPPTGGPGSVEFTAGDYARLGPDEFLNDTAIDYYLCHLKEELQEKYPADAERCYFFNSFFYKKLSEKSGGDLPPEIQAQLDSGELKLPKGELQSLRNYYKVRKWTRGVDIFAKDYIFVPIHDALHWSLVVLCHPGKDLGAGASARKPNTRKSSNSRVISDSPGPSQEGLSAAGGSSEADMVGDDDGRDADPRAAPQQEAFMLHLDSIRGAHSTSKYASTLRQYLTNEWKSKAADPIAPPDCIPKMWAAANPTEAARGRSFKEMKAPSVQVPSQDNHCDCGLFVCAFADFFLEAMPPGLSIAAVDKLYKDYSRDGRDLYEPACGTEGTDGTAVVKGYYPGFLTQHWFPVANGSNLRWEMSIMVLHHMARAAGMMDASGGLIPPSDDAPPERKAQFQALMDEMEEVKRRQSTAEYIRPRDYRRKGQENKDARARKRAAVVAKTAEAARLTRLAKAGGEPAKTGRKYSEEFMDLQHMKDSDEDYKPGDMKTFTRARKRRIDAVSRRELVAAAAENRAKAASQAQILEESVMDASLPDDSFQIDLEGGDTDLDGDVDASAFVQSKGLDVVEPEQSKQAARRKETPEEKAARIQSLNELYDYESKEELLGDRANGDAAFWETDPSSPVPAPKAKAAEPIDLLDSPARNAKQQKAPRASISAILNEPDSPEAPEDLGYVKAGRAPEALDAAVLLTIAAVPDGGYEATGAGDERGYTCKLVYGNGRPDLIVSANSRPEMWNWYITWGHLLPDSCGQSVPWDVASPAKEASRQAAEETVWQKLFPAKPRPSTGNDVMRDDNVSLQATEVQEASEDEDFDVESGAKLPFRPTTTAAPPTAAPAAGAAAHQAPPSTRRHVRFDSDDEVIVELREDVGRMGKDNGSGGLELGQPPAVDPRYVADQEPAETSGAEGSGWRRAGGARSGLDGRNASGSGYANGVERGRGRGKHGPGGRHAGGRHLHGERGGGRGRHHGEHRGGRYGLSEHGHMVNNISRMILGSLRKAGGGDGSNSRRSRRHQESRRGEKKGGQVDLTDDFTS